MRRILVLGSCGSGKSTFSNKLHELLGIEIIHLDQRYWKPGWKRTESEVWQKEVSDLVQGERWIMDGNYRSTMDIRLPRADTIIWLGFSPIVCFYRLLKRRLKKNRVDDLDHCRERISFELLRWVLWKFPTDNRKDIIARLELIKKEKDIFVLKSNKDIELFYSSVKNNN